jgi:hypothetical protein
MRISRPEKKAVIAILVKRTVSFFFGMCLLTLFFYGIGTTQGFMDITQLLLLRLSIVWGLFLGVGSLYGIILTLWLARKGWKFLYVRGLGAYMLLSLFGILVAAAAALIIVTAGGNEI